MQIKPLEDRVLARRLEAEEKSKGGIIIPDAHKDKPMMAEILAVGPGKRDDNGNLIPMSVKVGNIVLIGKWSGTEVKVDGEDLLILKETDILGIVEGVAGASKKAA